jgi:phosphatidylserine/phosphatidylglycerophosphate/cardiolipin synthase-like enzyme
MLTLLLQYIIILFLISPLQASIVINPYFSKTKGAYYKGGVDNNIIKDISEANSTIDMAMYYLTNKNITSSLIDAKKRGVEVRVFTDDKKRKLKRYKYLSSYNIEIRDDNNLKAIMHNKIIIIDKNITWIGSGNYTVFAFYRNYENFVRIKSGKIGKYYTSKFNSLYNKKDTIINPYKSKKLEIYFSKDSDIEDIIIKNISDAEISIDIMMFAFTNKKIANALIKAKKRGVKVKVILDRVQNRYQIKYSVYSYLKSKGIDISLENSKRRLHNKIIIIDEKIVITGSYNYTKQANLMNDENILVIKDSVIAKKFVDKFKSSKL